MNYFTAIVLSLFFSSTVFAQQATQICLGIEKTKIAGFCVPSTREICHSGQPGNCELMGSKAECIFVKGPNSYRAPTDDWSRSGLTCVAKENTNCRPTAEGTVCDSVCIKYRVPDCKTMCKPCYDIRQVEYHPIPGCRRFCGDKYCAGEVTCDPSGKDNPPMNMVCPYNQITDPVNGLLILPTVPGDKCGTPDYKCEGEVLDCKMCGPIYDLIKDTFEPSCNQSAFVAKLAEVCPNCVAGPDCRIKHSGETGEQSKCPPNLQQAELQPLKYRCPWITMPAGPDSAGKCDPVEVGNRFPEDCCVCTDGKAIPGSNPPVACSSKCDGKTKAELRCP